MGTITIHVEHNNIHAKDCLECTGEERASGGKIDRFERRIHIEGLDDPQLRAKLLTIADKCPVHRTLEHGAKVVTSYQD